ncbi:Rieske Fe-S protein [Nocardioides daedukensis]|uniref:Cytochrome bc1 complex Rieske iron-sulfur subunit n=1 Tax=Nocardioides daedukensis TaxID=634462 RepID=A0A7Y9S1G2_9ACTN|nr:Rieske (2Fe-2S) protein [Nocardioides daedukensis]NYG57770.1 Rieske Fe-S protein [Nocardioides daedukensis]
MDLSRRSTLGGFTAAGLALPTLAACGGGDSPSKATDPGTGTGTSATPSAPADESESSSPPSAEASTGLLSTEDVPVGGGVILAEEKLVVTQPTAGEFKGFTAVCTHQGCIVSAVSTTIDCGCHQSKFSLSDGSVQGGPAPSPLESRDLSVTGDQINLD